MRLVAAALLLLVLGGEAGAQPCAAQGKLCDHGKPGGHPDCCVGLVCAGPTHPQRHHCVPGAGPEPTAQRTVVPTAQRTPGATAQRTASGPPPTAAPRTGEAPLTAPYVPAWEDVSLLQNEITIHPKTGDWSDIITHSQREMMRGTDGWIRALAWCERLGEKCAQIARRTIDEIQIGQGELLYKKSTVNLMQHGGGTWNFFPLYFFGSGNTLSRLRDIRQTLLANPVLAAETAPGTADTEPVLILLNLAVRGGRVVGGNPIAVAHPEPKLKAGADVRFKQAGILDNRKGKARCWPLTPAQQAALDAAIQRHHEVGQANVEGVPPPPGPSVKEMQTRFEATAINWEQRRQFTLGYFPGFVDPAWTKEERKAGFARAHHDYVGWATAVVRCPENPQLFNLRLWQFTLRHNEDHMCLAKKNLRVRLVCDAHPDHCPEVACTQLFAAPQHEVF